MYGIFTYIYHKKSTIHVGKYTSPMDGMGIDPHILVASCTGDRCNGELDCFYLKGIGFEGLDCIVSLRPRTNPAFYAGLTKDENL